MGSPTNRLGLLIDSKTVGDASVEKLANSLNKVVSISERSGRSATKMGKDFSGVGSQIQAGFTNPVGAATQGITSMVASMGKAGPIIGGITLGLGAAAVSAFKLVTEIGKTTDMMFDFSARTGLAVNQVDRLQAMSKIAAVNMQTLEIGATRVSQAVSGVGESGKLAREAIDQLGVSVVDTEGNLRSGGEVLIDVLQALSELEDETLRLALANEILGRSGRELAPLIKAYDELGERVDKLGVGMDEQILKRLDKGRESIAAFVIQWDLLKRKLAIPATAVIEVAVSSINRRGEIGSYGATGPTSPTVQAGIDRAGLVGLAPIQAALRQLVPGVPDFALTGQTSGAPSAFEQRLEAARSQFAGTPEALKFRLSAAQSTLNPLNQRLATGGVLSNTELTQRGTLATEIAELTSQLAILNAKTLSPTIRDDVIDSSISGRRFSGLMAAARSPLSNAFQGVGMGRMDPAITGAPALDPRVEEFMRLREEGIQIAIDKEQELADARARNIDEFRFLVEDAFQSLAYGGVEGIKRFFQRELFSAASQFLSGKASGLFGGGGGGVAGGVFQGAGLGSAIFSAFGGKGGGGGGGGLTPGLIGLTNAGSPIGATGGLLSSILPAISSALPFVGIGMAGFSLISSLIGSGKQDRQEELAINIESARINVTGPTEFRMASGRGGIDTDVRGNLRRVPDDDEITDAVQRSIQRGHPINESMREAVLVA